jgi:PadR family transcriptional regulator PadR
MTRRTTPQANAQAGWLRAVLELAILAALTEGDRHGYALAQRLDDAGLGPVRGGVLYPVLSRLEAEEAVSSSWQAGEAGPGRKVYALTEAGRQRLIDEQAGWRQFAAAVEQFLAQTTGRKS